ncbi:MAG: biotin transporter BioY [Clostridia bacterium]|nr:biotin transporter BioY [Clostridia bacterium]MBR3038899.1 biotin transporter BioY [Clostridia bacterium]
MEQTANKPKFRTVELAYIALGAALIAVCAWITIPFTVPFTMQLFAVFFVLTVLGGRNGTIAIAVYLLLGSIGIPVFSGFKGGFGVLIGMTGGYLVGMLLIGLVYWLMTKLLKPSVWTELIAFAIGLILCYAFGTLWFSTLNGEKSFYASLAVCVVPFILPDILKLALAYFVGRKLRPLIP